MKIIPNIIKPIIVSEGEILTLQSRGYELKDIFQTIVWKFGKNWTVEHVYTASATPPSPKYNDKYYLIPEFLNKMVKIK